MLSRLLPKARQQDMLCIWCLRKSVSRLHDCCLTSKHTIDIKFLKDLEGYFTRTEPQTTGEQGSLLTKQCPPHLPHRLPNPVLIFYEGDADIPLAVVPKAGTGRDAHLRFVEQLH